MLDSLIGQQVIGWKIDSKSKDKYILDANVIGILSMMYPEFRLVKSMFEIYPDEPFIYIGDIKYINSVKDKSNPHIIVSNTGINLFDRKVLTDYVFAFIGKSTYKYMDDLLKFWDDATFYTNLKLILILGTVPDKEIDKSNLFLDLVYSLPSNTANAIINYLKILDIYDDYKSVESGLITFINNSIHMSDTNTKSDKMAILRKRFARTCGGSVSFAVNNLLESNIESNELRILNFILDITRGYKGG